MSAWTHPVCRHCFTRETGKPIEHAVRVVGPDTEVCCFCHDETTDGIFIRREPMAGCSHD